MFHSQTYLETIISNLWVSIVPADGIERWTFAGTTMTSFHYRDVIMSAMASQITSLTLVYSPVYSGVDQRKHQNSASLSFVRGIQRWPMNSPHEGPVTRKMFPFDDVIIRGPVFEGRSDVGTKSLGPLYIIANYWKLWKVIYTLTFKSINKNLKLIK